MAAMKRSTALLISVLVWIVILFVVYDRYHVNNNSDAELIPAVKSMKLSTEMLPVDMLKLNPTKAAVQPTTFNPDNADTDARQVVAPSSSKPELRNKHTYRVDIDGGMKWRDFVRQSRELPQRELEVTVPPSLHMNVCSNDVVGNVTQPALSQANFDWCKWALSPSGGKVKVGKSYGTLGGKDRDKYEQLNCNTVAQGKNPSCDDSWGDGYIASWKRNLAPDVCGDASTYTSKVQCMDSSSRARFCVFENAAFDFSKMRDVERPGRASGSRTWAKGFLATDCAKDRGDINFYEFYHPSVDRDQTRCTYVFNETVLAYSHDDIHNLGHSMSDFMNVWAMLWLSGAAPHARDVSFFNIDALRMGHSYGDQLNQFARHYETQFARVLKASDFSDGTVCFKRLVLQPRPVILFTWDGWWQDMPCTRVGPSSLFQRWNMQIRNNYGLLAKEAVPTNDAVQVLLIVRSVGTHSMGQQSRLFTNREAIVEALSAIEGIRLVVRDLAELGFEEQVRLMASSSLVVGMHGAGIASSMHMPVGSRHCCGVVEIFPQGEFMPIRGYGNMARRMGHHYERLELSAQNSGAKGGHVPPGELAVLVRELLRRMEVRPSCVLPSVIKDPHFSSVPSVWA